MQISRILSLSGPNLWSPKPVLEVTLRSATDGPPTGPLCDDDFSRISDWWHAARAAAGFSCSELVQFGDRLVHADRDVDAFEILALGLQTLAGTPVERAWIDRDDAPRAMRVAVEFAEEPVARLAVAQAHRLVWGTPFAEFPDPHFLISELRACAAESGFGTTTRAVVAAARSRRIPVSRVDLDCLLQLGHGAQQRLIQGSITGRAGFLAELVSRDKLLTKRLLRQLRLPTAEGRLAQSAEDAWAAACEIGLPVVVKPRNADYGNGVSLDLMTQAQVVAAWNDAREFRPDVLVERQLSGLPHRLFIVNDVLVAAARREPAQVVGDGHQSIGALIACANREPRRGDGPECPLYPIAVDEPLRTALRNQNLTLDSVPTEGRTVNLQLNPAECRAETILDVTDQVCPAVVAAALDAVRAVGLDVAGVDVVAVDIGQPLHEQGGGILEVNAGPAFYLHRSPQCRPGRPVAEAIVDSLFEPGNTGRIPLVVVLGEDPAVPVLVRTVADLLSNESCTVGVAGSAGICIGGRRLTPTSAADAAGCRTLLAHPRVDLAVLELSTESVRHEGLAFDECTLAVLVGAAVPGNRDGSRCLRLLADTIASDGAILADVDNPEVAAVCVPGERGLVAVAFDQQHPFLAEHRHRGGSTVFLDGKEAVLATRRDEVFRVPLSRDCDLETEPPDNNLRISLLSQSIVWGLDCVAEKLRAPDVVKTVASSGERGRSTNRTEGLPARQPIAKI